MIPGSDLQKIIEKNNQILEENAHLMKRMRRAMITGQILGWARLLVIIIPLALAYFYLKPYYQDTIRFYRELFNSAGGGGNLPMLLPELQEILGRKK